MLTSRMSSAQNSSPDACLPDERQRDLRESLRLCVILTTPPSSPLRSLGGSHPSRSLALALEPSRRRKFHPSVPTARPNPSRINTSANSSCFIKSLIINDLKSNRISKRSCKSPRINTSEICVCKSLRINTSRKHRGEAVGQERRKGRSRSG